MRQEEKKTKIDFPSHFFPDMNLSPTSSPTKMLTNSPPDDSLREEGKLLLIFRTLSNLLI